MKPNFTEGLESIKGHFIFPSIRFNDQRKTTFSLGGQMPENLVFKLKNLKGAIIIPTPKVIVMIELIKN